MKLKKNSTGAISAWIRNRNVFILVGLLLFTAILPLSSAESLGTFERNTDIELIQTCNNCTYCNLTSIKFPNGSDILTNVVMTQSTTLFSFDLSGGNTSFIGTYKYCYDCGNAVERVAGCIDFYVTPSGQESISSGQGIVLFGTLICMIIIGIFFLILGFKFGTPGAKMVFLGIASLVFIISILFSMVIIDQNLGGFSNLVESYATFWMVMKVIIGIVMLGLVLYSGLVGIRLWQFKRGFRD
jgi:hypothetical protein